MKTPREILTQRHRSAESKLDALRREVVAEHVIAPQFQAGPEAAPGFFPRHFVQKLWQELVLPCRMGVCRAWLPCGLQFLR